MIGDGSFSVARAVGARRLLLRALLQARAHRPGLRIAGASAVLLLVGLGIFYADRHSACWIRLYDDAYITLRYAEQLAAGHGLVFNVGERTDSASSFLYTLLLALFRVLGIRALPQVATAIGVASAAGTCAIVYLGCLERTERPLLSLFLAAAVGTHGLISGWAISGMETLFFTLLVAASAYRMFIRARLGWPEALLTAAVVLTRLEGLLLAGAWLLLVVACGWRADYAARRSYIAQASFLASIVIAFFVWKRIAYGTFLPHAFELKRVTVLYAPQPNALWDVWKWSASFILLLAAAGLFTLPKRAESAAWVLYTLVSLASLVLGPTADWARYSVHMLPIAVLLACVPLSVLLRTLPVIGWAFCFLCASQAYASFDGVRNTFNIAGGHQACRLKIGKYLQENVRGGEVLSSDLGAIAYAAPDVSFVDAVGLTSRDVLAARARGESADLALFNKKPTVIADTCHGRCNQPSDFSSHGWLTAESFWLTAQPGSTYDSHLHHGKVLTRCTSPDGLNFAVTSFDLSLP